MESLAQGPQLTARLSSPPRENPTEVTSMTVPAEPRAQTGEGSLLWGICRNGLPPPAGQSRSWGWRREGTRWACRGWHTAAPTCRRLGIEGLGCSRKSALQGQGVGSEEEEKENRGVGSRHDFATSASAVYKPTTKKSHGLEGPRGSQLLQISATKQQQGRTAAGRAGSFCHPVPSITDTAEQSWKVDTAREQSHPRPHDSLPAPSPQTWTTLEYFLLHHH